MSWAEKKKVNMTYLKLLEEYLEAETKKGLLDVHITLHDQAKGRYRELEGLPPLTSEELAMEFVDILTAPNQPLLEDF